MKKKTKPTSVRLDNKLLKELDQRCEKVGCSRNDFIKNSVDFIISGQSEFNFGDEEDFEEPKPLENIRIFDCDDGKMYENGIKIGNCKDFHLENGKVFDDNEKQIGIIQPKPKVEIIYD